MIEQGIVKLVQSDLTVNALVPVGGFFAELPKDQALPNWSYRSISLVANTGLQFSTGLRMMRLQIDVYGDINGRGADSIALAKAIDHVLNGFAGTLSDPDSTFVSSCFLSDEIDFFDDAGRTYRRMLEYEILFAQN